MTDTRDERIDRYRKAMALVKTVQAELKEFDDKLVGNVLAQLVWMWVTGHEPEDGDNQLRHHANVLDDFIQKVVELIKLTDEATKVAKDTTEH